VSEVRFIGYYNLRFNGRQLLSDAMGLFTWIEAFVWSLGDELIEKICD
jgi:hypothetical protein